MDIAVVFEIVKTKYKPIHIMNIARWLAGWSCVTGPSIYESGARLYELRLACAEAEICIRSENCILMPELA